MQVIVGDVHVYMYCHSPIFSNWLTRRFIKFSNQILIGQIESSIFIMVLRNVKYMGKKIPTALKVLIKIDIYYETPLLLYDNNIFYYLSELEAYRCRSPRLDTL